MLRGRLQGIEDQLPAEKEWWEKRRDAIRKDFMNELDEEAAKAPGKAGAEEDGVLVELNTPASTPSGGGGGGGKKKKGKK